MPNRKLKNVCHIVRRFVIDKWGGTEAVVLNYCQNLQAKGIKSSIYSTNILAPKKLDCVNGVKVRRFKYIFPWFRLNKNAKEKLKLKGGSPLVPGLLWSLLWNKDISIIHTHTQHRMGGIARTVAKLRKIPYVVSLHGNYLTLPEKEYSKMTEPFKGKVEWGKVFGFLLGSRKTVKDADAVICVDKNEYNILKEKFPKKKIVYLPNGVDTEKFSEASSLFKEFAEIKEGEKYILCVSRIDYQKNQRLLVKAFSEFSRTNKNYKLVLIGPVTVEKYLDKINEDIKDYNLEDKVVIIPGLKHDDKLLLSAYKGADMFILPSNHEPFGIVILEAWAAGVPVIASKLKGIEAFTENKQNILHFEPGKVNDLLIKIKLLKNSDIRSKLTANATVHVQKFSWSSITEQLESLYSTLLKKKAGK